MDSAGIPGKMNSEKKFQVTQRNALGTLLDFGTSSMVFPPALHHGLSRSRFQSLLLYLIRAQNSGSPKKKSRRPAERTATLLCSAGKKEKTKQKKGMAE